MAQSIFMQCLESLRDKICTLELDGLPANRIAVRRLPHDGSVYFPGISLHPVTETYHQGDNGRENIGYGCAVTMVVNNDRDQDYLLDRLLLWRETIRRTFVERGHQYLTLTDGRRCTLKVEHGHVIDWDTLYNKNYDVSSLILRAYVLETRL